jgi:2,3-diketo-5-methylthio-1-phosphopentane phosphatase
MHLQFFCDFDGTVTRADVTDVLLQAFADPAWHAIEEEWLAGDIGSAECMARQIALIRADRATLDAALDAIPVDPHFAEFAAYCRREGLGLAIVSDGLDYAIRRILARMGVTGVPVYANHLHLRDGGRYALTSPNARTGCGAGTCKCHIVAPGAAGETVLIGDGRSDFCGATAATLTFAKDKLLAHCRAERLPHRPYRDFRDVLALATAMVAGRREAAEHETQPMAGLAAARLAQGVTP